MLPRKKAHGDTPPIKTCARKNLGNRSVSGLSSLKLCHPPYPIGPRRGKGQAWDAEHKHLAQFKAKPQRRGSTAPARAKPWGQAVGPRERHSHRQQQGKGQAWGTGQHSAPQTQNKGAVMAISTRARPKPSPTRLQKIMRYTHNFSEKSNRGFLTFLRDMAKNLGDIGDKCKKTPNPLSSINKTVPKKFGDKRF